MDLTDIIYSNDYINILIQNYVAPVSYTHLTLPTT